jgi:hypothetical protein
LADLENLLKIGNLNDEETINQSIIEIIDVYERSIKRKNAEIEVIKSCLSREKSKL